MKIHILIILVILVSLCHSQDPPIIDINASDPIIDIAIPIIDNVSPTSHPIAGNLLDPHYVNRATDIIRNWAGEQSIVEQEQNAFLNDYNDTCLNCTENITA